MEFIHAGLQYVVSILNTVSVFDFVDIAIVAFLIYKLIQLVRETRAEQLVKGLVVLAVAYYVTTVMGLKTMSYIMYNIVQFGVLALIVVFQPELRNALERLGRSKIRGLNFLNFDSASEEQLNRESIDAVCEAAQALSKNRIGALILFEMDTKLGDVIKTGTIVNADISAELLVNIFYPKAPLHDGAMVLRKGRIHAAGCFLPLSQNLEISRELGTRHRAALGISENSDTLVVVVSEETGIISLVRNGVIKRNLTPETLQIALETAILPQKQGEKRQSFRLFGKRS